MNEMESTITSDCYMILDIGGGTVDISIHKLNASNEVEVILPTRGNAWGGTTVNTEFKQFLGQLVNDPKFNKYVDAKPERRAKHSADLDRIVYQLFENQKKFFGKKEECSKDKAIINLPYTFMKVYGNDLEYGVGAVSVDDDVTLAENELILSYKKMAEFFVRPLQEITSCVLESLKEASDEGCVVKNVFLVGGFGGCKYLASNLESEIKKSYNKIECFRPKDHETAVASGAVLFRRNTAIIKSRRVDATYGIECSAPFDRTRHNAEYCFLDDDKRQHCRHLFLPFVKKGDIVCADNLLCHVLSPMNHAQESMTFHVYTSSKDDVHYVRAPNGKDLDDVKMIGAFTVKMPHIEGDKKRQVKLTFDFTHTEIQIQAYDMTSGETYFTVVDFLK